MELVKGADPDSIDSEMKNQLKRALDVLGLRESLWDTWFYRLAWKDSAGRAGDRAMVEFYERLAVENQLLGKLWFDVGANVGSKTACFLKLCSTVVAVEPDPRNLATLERRMRFRPNVKVIRAGVGAQPGTLSLVCAGAYSTLSTKEAELLRREEGFQGAALTRESLSVNVRVVTLDELIQTHGLPAFVKIDVEGFEVEVFSGLSQPIRMVCFEANLPEFEAETIRCIERYVSLAKAEFNYTTEEPPRSFASDRWLRSEELCALIRAKRIGYCEIYGRVV